MYVLVLAGNIRVDHTGHSQGSQSIRGRRIHTYGIYFIRYNTLPVILVYGTRFPMELLSSVLDYCGTCPFGHGSIVMHHPLVYGPAVRGLVFSLFDHYSIPLIVLHVVW
jgi:hypothetical protein